MRAGKHAARILRAAPDEEVKEHPVTHVLGVLIAAAACLLAVALVVIIGAPILGRRGASRRRG